MDVREMVALAVALAGVLLVLSGTPGIPQVARGDREGLEAWVRQASRLSWRDWTGQALVAAGIAIVVSDRGLPFALAAAAVAFVALLGLLWVGRRAAVSASARMIERADRGDG